jgi:hypothetical protein
MIPNSLLERFCDLAEEFDLRGKFSIVPRPGAAGSINSQIEGVPVEEMHVWLDLARRRVVPRFDITPEMITHDWAVDLATMQPLAENEHDWSQRQTTETLRPYVAFALGELKQAGFDATGVTSPWAFGQDVEADYARAILEAQQQVYGRQDTWYFLRFSEAVDATARVMILETDDTGTRRSCVSVFATCSDFIWQTMDTPRTDSNPSRVQWSFATCLLKAIWWTGSPGSNFTGSHWLSVAEPHPAFQSLTRMMWRRSMSRMALMQAAYHFRSGSADAGFSAFGLRFGSFHSS